MARKFFLIVALAVLFAIFYDPDTFEPESIRGKRVLVTGASSGIGEQLAYHYSTMGASVVITARREELLKKVASKCKELGATKVGYVVADMGNSKDRIRLVQETEKHLGGLDHLILNHAVINFFLWKGSAKNMTTLENDMDVNFVSYVDLASRCHKMLSASKGNIGVVSSSASKMTNAFFHSYAASKHALHGFFNGYREELKHSECGISVTLCVLGLIDNERSHSLRESTFPNYEVPTSNDAPKSNDTALAIIKGVTKRVYEFCYPFLICFYLNLHKVLPHYLEEQLSNMFFDATE